MSRDSLMWMSISQNISAGTLWSSSQFPVAQDVCPWSGHVADRTWLHHLPQQVGAIACMRFGGRAIHSRTCLSKLNERGDSGDLLWHLPIAMAARETTLWCRDGGASPPKKSWIQSRNVSSISGIAHCQRRDLVDAPPAPPGMTPGQLQHPKPC